MKSTELENRELFLFQQSLKTQSIKTDKAFAILLVFQWILGIVFALKASPYTWIGDKNYVHIHVFASIFLGGLISSYPLLLCYKSPGKYFNRFPITAAQMLYSTLFIHLTGGRIETHFHIFGSLAFLTFYRDYKPILFATAITAFDHFIRGYFWPESVYGVLYASPWRAVEHAGWVLFEDSFLFVLIKNGIQELKAISKRQAETDLFLKSVEEEVEIRTNELNLSNKLILEQQKQVTHSASLAAVGTMAAGVAHEINNPLSIILGRVHILKRDLEKKEYDQQKLIHSLDTIENTAKRITKIIYGLRTFSRNGDKLPFEKISFQKLIDEILALCEERFKNHSIQLNVTKEDATFECRSIQIGQIILNLLNNAFDAIQSKKNSWVNIDLEENINSINIIITDSGEGIPDEIAQKIMQPFFTTKAIGKGTGLGLSISVGIAQDHGGSLNLDRTSKNTRFILSLPKNQVKS